MQSRVTFMYVLMLGLFGVGLWLIIGLGSIYLRAPEDLSGQWWLHSPGAAPDEDPLMPMTIEQSGQYFKIYLGDTSLDLKLVEELRSIESAQSRVRLRLVGEGVWATFEGRRGGELFDLQLEGPLRGPWVARRIKRTYARSPNAESARVPAHAAPHARR